MLSVLTVSSPQSAHDAAHDTPRIHAHTNADRSAQWVAHVGGRLQHRFPKGHQVDGVLARLYQQACNTEGRAMRELVLIDCSVPQA